MRTLGLHRLTMSMNFLSNPLTPLLEALDKQNDTLGKARAEYLTLEAEKRHREALLIKQAEGKSHAEKVTNAQANIEWQIFQNKIARAEAVYEFQKLKFSILEKEWQSSYLTLKLDGQIIKKQE